MKKPHLRNVFALILAAFSLAGCDWFDKVDEISFDGIVPVEFVVNEDGVSEMPVLYSRTEILNALDNDEINKYKNKITGIKLNRITYQIENYSGAEGATLTDASLRAGDQGQTLISIESLVLENTPETEFEITDPDGFTQFAMDLKEAKQVAVTMEGTLSSSPVTFTVKAYFHLKVTAEVLD